MPKMSRGSTAAGSGTGFIMSKAINLDMILSGASTHVDGSLSLRFSTAELKPSEKLVVFELLNRQLKCLLQPTDSPMEEIVEIKTPLDMPSPSQRLRNTIYVLYKQKAKPDENFQTYYINYVERLISHIKEQLDPES